ncbi:integrase [Alteromonadales bacterium alter-6D02]|nr:integrase [Alteromonadales bacterium alter-6D02]
MLLDYKLFCEDEGLDYLDFSAGRPGSRPSYRYFQDLLSKDAVSRKNLNKRTLVVYDFYKFITEIPGFNIDITLVESAREAFIRFSNGYSKKVEIRSQTVRVNNQAKEVPLGYVRDDGEDLRPLTNEQCDEFIDVLSRKFSVDERLIHSITLNTGARKQSVFTMRVKHLKLLNEANLTSDGSYRLKAGPRTGIDTKFGKSQTLYFPRDLADQLKVYANSKLAKERRSLFSLKHGDILNEDDMYLFISTHGNCHYMAKNDPRYRQVKSRPKGEHTNYLKQKLLKFVSSDFPKDFTFHWLRATYALMYHEYLVSLVADGKLKLGNEITRVQQRLHHTKRETTENYLKLFTNINEKMAAQEAYEERLFEGITF